MFDWVWSLLYGISKSIYRIIDFLMECANMLCGIEPVKYQGVETDFLTFLLQNKNITLGFVAAALIGVVLTFIFGVAALIRVMVTEKGNMTPQQVMLKVGKTLLMFLFIPVALAIFVYFTNVLMQALYQATLGGSSKGIGTFLCGAFGQDALRSGVAEDFYLEEGFDYFNTGMVKGYLDLSDYDYFFSWIGGICILISLGLALVQFIDRAISIVILFIFSPISLSASVFDEGAHFKLWREQFIIKFLMGYGCIIAINIYTLIIAAITSNGLVFFNNNLLNNFMKILIIVGGAVSMQRIMALVGNLLQSGAGSNELRDAAIAGAKMSAIGGKVVRGGIGAALMPFKAARSAINFSRDAKQYGFGATLGDRLGFKTSKSYGQMSDVQMGQRRQLMKEREAMRRQSDSQFFGSDDKAKNAINGEKKGNDSGNANNKKAGAGNKMVNNAINNAVNKNQDDLSDLR